MVHFLMARGLGRKSLITIILNAIRHFWEEEFPAQRPQMILLVPILIAFGIGGYFSLPSEPPWFVGLCVMAASLIGVFITRDTMRLLLIGVLLIGLGFSAAQLRTYMVHTPILAEKLEFKTVSGRVHTVENLDKGLRLTLSDVEIEDLAAENTPTRIRLKIRGDADFFNRAAC